MTEEMKGKLMQALPGLRADHGVQSLGVFGSTARGEDRQGSDIDVLIEFSRPISLFKFIELEEHLSSILGQKVDLVTKRALKPAIKNAVLQEVIYV